MLQNFTYAFLMAEARMFIQNVKGGPHPVSQLGVQDVGLSRK